MGEKHYSGIVRTTQEKISLDASYRELDELFRKNYVKIYENFDFENDECLRNWFLVHAYEIVICNPEFIAGFEEYRGAPFSNDREKLALLFTVCEAGTDPEEVI